MPEIFVNRDSAKHWFGEAVSNIPRDGVSLRAFHGAGGQGKSALCFELNKAIRNGKYDTDDLALKVARISFEHVGNRTDPIIWMIRVRNEFAELGVSLPGFDLALAFVWESVRPQDTPPNLKNAWLSNASDTIGEGVTDTVEATRDVIEDEVEKIPLLGVVLRKLSKWTIDKSRKKWLLLRKDYLEAFFRDSDVKDDHELIDTLLGILAKDLSHTIEKQPELRFVILLDEYEGLFQNADAGAKYLDQPVDSAIRRFVEDAQGLLIVFFTRTPPAWPDSPFWEFNEEHHFDITGLERQYALEWLEKAGLEDEGLRTEILTSCRVQELDEERYYPLLLSLCVEYYQKMQERGRSFTPEDFKLSAGALDFNVTEILNRVLREYGGDKSFELTFECLSIADQFDKDTLNFVVETYQTRLPGDGFSVFKKLSFIEENDNGFLSIHRKIAEVTRRAELSFPLQQQEDALISHFLERADEAMNNQGNPQFADLLFFQANNIRTRQGAHGYVDWLSDKLKIFGHSHRALSDEVLWRQALNLCLTEFGKQHLDTATSYSGLAYNMHVQGRYREAEPLSSMALDTRRRLLGEDDLDTATSYNNLGYNLYYQGRYTEADPLLRNALDIRRRVLGKDHPVTATSYDNLAYNLNAQGRYKEAEPLARRGLYISQRELGEDHPHTATSYDNLGYNLFHQGLHVEAEPHFRKALAIRQRVLGEDHPDTATSYNNVASCLDALKRYQDAEPLYGKGLDIYLRTLGGDHPDTATSFNNVGTNLDAQGRYQEAEPLHRTALGIRQRVLGEDHPYTATSYNNVGANLDAQGRYQEAERIHRIALSIRRRLLGDNHPDIASSYNNAAGVLHAQGRYEEADPLLREALDIAQRLLGEDHPLTKTLKKNHEFNRRMMR